MDGDPGVQPSGLSEEAKKAIALKKEKRRRYGQFDPRG